MLAALIIWSYLLILLWLYGRFSITLLGRFLRLQPEDDLSFPVCWIAGLCLVTTLGAALSLFIPLGLLANALLLGGALPVAFWLSRQPGKSLRFNLRRPPALALILLALAALTILENATHPAANPDSGIYHAQAIRWIESFPAAPGLGNLHTRLAYNSSWLVANALFSFSFLGLRSFHLLPGAFQLVVILYLAAGPASLLKRQARPSDWVKTLLLPLSFIVLGSETSSPGTDLPVTLLIWVIVIEWMVSLESRPRPAGVRPALLALGSFFAVTLKLSALPILLAAFILWLGYLRQKNPAAILGLAVGGGLILAPWLARSAVLSGYLIYPLAEVDLLNPDWKMPAQIVVDDRIGINSWGKLPRREAAVVNEMPLTTWAPLWFDNQTLNRRLILLATLAAPLVVAGLWLADRSSRETLQKAVKRYWPAGLAAWAGLLFWLSSSPDFRFGYGFLISALLLGLLPAILSLERRLALQAGAIPLLIVALLVINQGSVLYRSFNAGTIGARLALPADYIRLPSRPCRLQDLTIWCAEQYSECWYEPFPCVPAADPAVGLRGAGLAEGFRRFDHPSAP